MRPARMLLAMTLTLAACAEPGVTEDQTSTTPPGQGTEPDPATTGIPVPSSGEEVTVIVTATPVAQSDGSIELCPPGMTSACPGILLEGDIDPYLISAGERMVVVEVTGSYDGRRLLAITEPLATEHPAIRPISFESLCPDLEGTPSVNPDQALVEAVDGYARAQADYAATWWDQESAILTVWFKGDDVSPHQVAIADLAGAEPVCVAGGARFSEAELLEAAELLREFRDSRGQSLATGGFGVGGIENRIDLPVEELDASTAEALVALVGEPVPHPYIFMPEGSLSDLPPPVPAVEGDVEILISRLRLDVGMDALGEFEVGYDAELNCVYFNEQGAGRTVPVWPFGYSATSSPLTVFDYDGDSVASEGDVIALGGGGVSIDSLEGLIVAAGNTCDADDAWIVNR